MTKRCQRLMECVEHRALVRRSRTAHKIIFRRLQIVGEFRGAACQPRSNSQELQRRRGTKQKSGGVRCTRLGIRLMVQRQFVIRLINDRIGEFS